VVSDPAPAADAEKAVRGETGPRIYNLFPPLAGSVPDWTSHLRRIAGMNFDWVFVNPFHATGASGSIYAIKDPYSLSDLALGPMAHGDQRATLRQFTSEAGGLGL
jgi:starch synthase (maltosyl-transferring)